MTFRTRSIATLLLLVAALGWSAHPAAAGPLATPPGITLLGTLTDGEAWRAFRARFVTEQGRVVDTANGGISHSEGQGYGMVLAVAANDQATFERIWGWTRANLMVRNDQLVAWRWEPDRRPGVADLNNASDGDLLIAWALTEAAEAWRDPAHRVAARRIAVELGRKLIVPRSPHGPLLLPGVAGFAAEDRADGPVVNLSYWIFPAFERLPLVAPEFDWAGVARNGIDLVERARFGAARLPVEWTSLHGETPRPADGFTPVFGYNAVRIPLYLAWAGLNQADLLGPFLALWSNPDPRGLPIVDVTSGRAAEWLSEAGYGAVADLAACAVEGASAPRPVRPVRVANDHYFPVALHMMTLVAARMRYPQCLRG